MRSAPGNFRRRRLSLCAAALIAATALLGCAVSAQASPGGASAAVGDPSGEIAFSPYRSAGASWYGPGLWGRKTACGQVLRPSTLGVAHRNLPCGTTVKFLYHGHALVTTVIDRGPYVKGRAWDLTAAASEALEFEGAGTLRYAVATSLARPGA